MDRLLLTRCPRYHKTTSRSYPWGLEINIYCSRQNYRYFINNNESVRRCNISLYNFISHQYYLYVILTVVLVGTVIFCI